MMRPLAVANFALHRQEWATCVCIQKMVAEFYGLRLEDITSSRRARVVSIPRMVAMYICRHATQTGYNTLGHIFNKERTTVMSGVRRVEKLTEGNPSFKLDVDMLMTQLGGSTKI